MKYISIDVETTGIDRENCQILSFGAVIEDTEKNLSFDEIPKFHCAILRESVHGELFALNMNKSLIENIVRYQDAKNQDEKNDIVNETGMIFLPEEEVVKAFFRFCFDNGVIRNVNSKTEISNGRTYPMLNSSLQKTHITVAGKNFATFDKVFIERLPRWKQVFAIRSRILDPAILFMNWKTDEAPPSLDLCKIRASVAGTVSHNAVEDAFDVIKVLRTKY